MLGILRKIFGKKEVPTVGHALLFNPKQEHQDLEEKHKDFFDGTNTPEDQLQSGIGGPPAKIVDMFISRSGVQAPVISSSAEILEGIEIGEDEDITDNFELEPTEEMLGKDIHRGFDIKDYNVKEEDEDEEYQIPEDLMQSHIGQRKPTRQDMLRAEGTL